MTGIASWKIMLSVFGGGFLTALDMFNAIGTTPAMMLPAWQHLPRRLRLRCRLHGYRPGDCQPYRDRQMDLRTSSAAVCIRVLNPGYPEGMMLSILLMNALAPLIDYFVVQANISRRLKRAKAAAAAK